MQERTQGDSPARQELHDEMRKQSREQAREELDMTLDEDHDLFRACFAEEKVYRDQCADQ